MTTPEEPPGNTTVAAGSDPAADRVTRPQLTRATSRRGRNPSASAAATAPPAAAAPAGQNPGPTARHSVKLTEAAASAVQTGYNVIAENIEQGRKAAAKFREGKYNIRDVPKDAQEMGERVLKAARDFSTTAIDVGEWLLKTASSSSAGKQDGRDGMKLTVRVSVGGAAHKLHTMVLDRPKSPGTGPEHLSVRGLEPHPLNEGAVPISKDNVSFTPDYSVEGGLVAEVRVPAGQTAGVYTGQVYATRAGEQAPLGLLSVDVPATPTPEATAT